MLEPDWRTQEITRLRADWLTGQYHLDLRLGLEAPPGHLERAEKDALTSALPELGVSLGPAGRLIDLGVFAGKRTFGVAAGLDRLKSILVVAPSHGDLQNELVKVKSLHGEAEVQVLPYHGGDKPDWTLEPMAQGRTLALCLSGAYGLLTVKQATDFWQHLGEQLSPSDLVLITIEPPRDAARIEADYQTFGSNLVKSCLSKLGRFEALSPRTIFVASGQSLKFGAISDGAAIMNWNGEVCAIPAGTWISCGAMRFLMPDDIAREAIGFQLTHAFSSENGTVVQVILEKTTPTLRQAT